MYISSLLLPWSDLIASDLIKRPRSVLFELLFLHNCQLFGTFPPTFLYFCFVSLFFVLYTKLLKSLEHGYSSHRA